MTISVGQGERPMFNYNKEICLFYLIDILPSPRGTPQIEVTFDIDSNGILSVSAKDKSTGKKQSIRIEASSGLSSEEIEKMKREAQENAEKDQKFKEEIGKLNEADTLIFQTEKQIKDYGDKLTESNKTKIKNALKELKSAHSSKNFTEIERATKLLNEVWAASSQELYNTQQSSGNTQNMENLSKKESKNTSGADQNSENIQDVDFEEVK